MYLSVIIPCYNEEKRIGKTLEAIHSYLKNQPYQSEIIVVDNGSTDSTAQIVNGFQNSIPNLNILTEKSHGKGWAVKQGMLFSKGDYRLFTDADNSTDIAQVEKLFKYIHQGYDVVISSRKVAGAILTQAQPISRIWLGNIFAWFVRLVIPLGNIRDTQNGFKLFSSRVASKIFAEQTIYHWAFDVEVLALAKKFGFKIKEVPITWVNDERSKMNIKGMVQMIFEIILIRLHL